MADPKCLFDACQEFSQLHKRLKPPSIAEIEIAQNKATKVYQSSLAAGIKILLPTNANYPYRLLNANQSLLFVKGDVEILNSKYIAGLIGSRNPQPWAAKSIRHLAHNCVDSGVTVLSGLAQGCDTEAHLGCLEAGGLTIAILGNGIENIHPKSNHKLAETILTSGGCLISEYSPNDPVRSFQLTDRSKRQAELSDCIIVAQAKIKSGSMYAPLHALKKANKPVAVFSGDQYMGNEFSGNHKLINSHGATALTTQEEGIDFISSIITT